MNFKERFNLNIQNNIKYENNEIDVKAEAFSFDMFCRNNEVEKILRNTFIKDKNVIIASKKNSNKDIIYSYIKKFIGKAQSVEVVENIEDDISFTNASKIIVPEPNIYELVKILEFILCDYKSFIFSLNIKSYENIIESLKTLILLNFPNLSNSNALHLIGSTQAIVIYVKIDEKGNYFITNIGEIEYKEGKILLNNLYDKQKKEKALLEDYGDLAEIEEKEEEIKDQNELVKTTKEISEEKTEAEHFSTEEESKPTTEDVEDIETTTIEIKEENTEKIEVEKNTIEEGTKEAIPSQIEEIVEEVKTNKYKQLREKIKKRKLLAE